MHAGLASVRCRQQLPILLDLANLNGLRNDVLSGALSVLLVPSALLPGALVLEVDALECVPGPDGGQQTSDIAQSRIWIALDLLLLAPVLLFEFAIDSRGIFGEF